MELPKKIYLFESPIGDNADDRWLIDRSCEDDIEYIRTNVLLAEIERLKTTTESNVVVWVLDELLTFINNQK